MALTLGKYSLGVGDRFAREAEPQLAAFPQAARLGLEIVPVWNKSNREHAIVGTEPGSVREAARAAIGYKMAARLGMAYLDMLQDCRPIVARNVTGNLFERHIRPIFLGPA